MSADNPIGYLVDLTTLDKIRFQYNPVDFSDSKSSELGATKVVGGSHPIVRPASGGPRKIKFKLQFHRKDEDTEFVLRQVEALMSLVYPHVSQDPSIHGAPFVQFIFGELYNLVGLIEDIGVKLHEAFDPVTLYPEFADIDVSFQVTSDTIISASMVRNGRAAFRSPQSAKYERS
jgi:hypothetical protein